MVDAIRRALGDPAMPAKQTQWWPMRLASPFVPVLREVMEMKYLWEQPVQLRNDRLKATLGDEPRTALDEAVQTMFG